MLIIITSAKAESRTLLFSQAMRVALIVYIFTCFSFLQEKKKDHILHIFIYSTIGVGCVTNSPYHIEKKKNAAPSTTMAMALDISTHKQATTGMFLHA